MPAGARAGETPGTSCTLSAHAGSRHAPADARVRHTGETRCNCVSLAWICVPQCRCSAPLRARPPYWCVLWCTTARLKHDCGARVCHSCTAASACATITCTIASTSGGQMRRLVHLFRTGAPNRCTSRGTVRHDGARKAHMRTVVRTPHALPGTFRELGHLVRFDPLSPGPGTFPITRYVFHTKHGTMVLSSGYSHLSVEYHGTPAATSHNTANSLWQATAKLPALERLARRRGVVTRR